MRVVIVDEELPFPTTSGKRIRSFNLATRLAKRCELTYLCHRNRDAQEAQQALKAFRDHGIEVVFANQHTPGQSVLARGPQLYARLALNLLSNSPYLVQLHNTRAIRRCIQEYKLQHRVDLWHVEWTPYFAALDCVSSAPRVVMAHNIESLIWQRYFETERNALRRWYIAQQWKKFERFERQVCHQATRFITVSEADAELARERFGAQRVDVVDNGVDPSYFQASDEQRDPKRVLFLGSLDWRPNLDAVEVLLDDIWPRVLKLEPSAHLSIVGRKPPEWLKQKAARVHQVTLHADVPDVRPLMNSCGQMAVPLRIGGGSRLKILEALATGMPVVSTSVGAEGLRLTPAEHFTEVNTPEEMTRALVGNILCPRESLAMAQRGRQVILTEYNWDFLANKLGDLWRDCVGSEQMVPGQLWQARGERSLHCSMPAFCKD